MSGDRVSVVMPTLNVSRWLRQTLDTIENQTRPPLEIVIVDGGSTDGTREIAERCPLVRFLVRENTTPPVQLNIGFREAKGDLIAIMSADDLWDLRKLEIQAPFLLSHPDAPGSIAHFRFFLEPGCRIPEGFNPALIGPALVGRIPETLLARREAFFSTVGFLREDYWSVYDVEWFARIVERKLPMPVLPDVLLHKRIHDANMSSKADIGNHLLFEILRDSLRRRRDGGADAR